MLVAHLHVAGHGPHSRTDDRGYYAFTGTYQAANGLYAGLYLNHSLHGGSVCDDVEPSLGYKLPWHNAWDGAVQFTHFFSPGDSPLLKTELSNDLNANFGRDLDLVYLSLNADAYLGSVRDAALALDVTRFVQLPLSRRDTLNLDPTVELGSGTQHFYQRRLAARGAEGLPTRAGSFTLTGCTFSLPLTYKPGTSWATCVTPSYLLPLHVLAGINAHPLFYLSFDVTHTLLPGGRRRR